MLKILSSSIISSILLLLLNPITTSSSTSLNGISTASLGLIGVQAASEPKISHTLFDNLPARIFYFDDTSVVIYHDQISKNVFRSTDEGATWNVLSGVPSGVTSMILEHPFDSKISFVLTSTTKHYRSMDRGASWASFETSLPPSIGSNTMSFHSTNWNWILFTGSNCESLGGWKGRVCSDETFYTKDAFSSAPLPLLKYTSKCIFAHDKTTYSLSVPTSLIYCVAFEPPTTSSSNNDIFSGLFGGMRSLKESRLYSSEDFFEKDRSFVDLGIGKEARGIVGIGSVSKYLVIALKPINGGSNEPSGNEMILYVTENSQIWSRALFPHGSGLKESAYTIVESTPHSILVDVDSSTSSITGTLFTSNSNGTYFVKSLDHTNRNSNGIVDFEKLVGVEGVAMVNTVTNFEEAERGEERLLKTRITFDDGARWNLLSAPSVDHKGKKVTCDTSDSQTCSLHLHSVTSPHNYGRVFSSPAPGLVMGVGSIGSRLLPYDESDTFLSTDNGLNWKMVEDGAMKYEFGDKGSLLVMVDDEDATDEMRYSFDFGKTWSKVDLGVKLRARLLTTIPDSTSLKFLLLGTLTRKSEDKGSKGERHIVVGVDFTSLNKRKCSEKDMEKWYARSLGGVSGKADCLMGHKQWFLRRKEDADCVVDQEFDDPVGVEENCPCSDEDYECDYNFAPDGNDCLLAGPETVPAGACARENDLFSGSSGFRLIPGNTCDVRNGIKKDTPVMKSCHAAVETPGLISHSIFSFPGIVRDQSYFSESHTLIAFTTQNKVWQSSNEGYSWNEAANGAFVVAMLMHSYSRDRAYLITDSRTVHYTTDKGSSWNTFTAPLEPNTLSIPLLDFHPLRGDWLIWTGAKDCTSSDSSTCRAVSYYTKDNGRNWYQIEEYVRICTWGRDRKLRIDERIIFCESYRDKKGSQRNVLADNNPMRLISGENFYSGKKTTLFEAIVGFATFEEYMVVAALQEGSRALDLMISLNAKEFAHAQFPPNMKLENQAYTVLQSTTDSIFLHVTTHPDEGSEWGTLFKSNSNGTYYSPALTYANRNTQGYVDFEKMIGLDGIAVINVVSNPEEAAISRKKKLVTKITHNDGGRWKPMTPPAKDSLGRPYDCTSTKCSLHIHGFTERKDPRATYSSPSAVGLMLAVGNVGESLIAYADSDTFLTRDGGFTWEEVHKDAHQFEYGDQGSILLLVNDEDVTDHVTYSLDEGLTWSDYNFGQRIRVRSVVTVPLDTSRKFILFGAAPDKTDSSLAVHLDFTSITNKKCVLNLASPNDDDFELWSPSENREEKCLFGRQTLFHRRIRDRMCYIGERLPQPASIVRNCPCGEEDFECEFNYQRNSDGRCVLTVGAVPLASEDQCSSGQSFWYERTALRKIPHSTCEGGLRLDQGFAHPCPGTTSHGFLFYATFILFPFLISGLAALWYQRRRGGKIRLGEPTEVGGVVDVLVSIPFFIIGTIAVIVGYVKEMEIPFISDRLRRSSSRGYRGISIDDDAEILNSDLRDYEDEEE